MSEHFIIKCSKCDATISQCRCPAPDKKVVYEVCNKCSEEKS